MSDKLALDKPYITLTCNPYEHDTSVNTRITFDVMEKDLSRDEMIEVCENFMKAMGYNFAPHEALDVIVQEYDQATGVTVARDSPKVLVGVRIPGRLPN